jgi:hypothetical protein
LDPHAAVSGLIEAFDEVLDLRQHLLIPHGLGRLVHVHHHGPLKVGDRAGYRVYALIRELSQIIDRDRLPLSPRIVVLKEIFGQLRPEPVREPLRLPKVYTPPERGRYRRRRG